MFQSYLLESLQSLQALNVVASKSSPSIATIPAQVITPDPDYLISSVGVDYSKLRDLLAWKAWGCADRETAALILKVAGRKKEGFLTVENIEKFPCEDLRTIDQLWDKYSKGRFGFSVQKRIWQQAEDLETFAEVVGWRSQGRFSSSWKSYYALTLTLDAPKGHLPWRSVTIGRKWDKNFCLLRTLFYRVHNCKL